MRKLKINRQQYGNGQRLLHQENELENAPIVPSPVEYDDIDSSMIEFFDSHINLSDSNGNKVPIFKLLSNQRFSEYTQTWDHTDNDGNLLMNFKTITREIDPEWGTIHSGMANIPGDNRFTLHIRDVVDDTGVEYYEVTSMSQPLSVDLKYTVTLVSSKLDLINQFNIEVIKLFKSKQCYIFPNGHAMPMVIDNIGDDSNYDINGRKFYSQPVTIKVMAYVIPKDDIKVEMKPKRLKLDTNLESNRMKTYVDMDFKEDSDDFTMNIKFGPNSTKVKFQLEDKVEIKLNDRINANAISFKVNDEIYSIGDKIVISPEDTVVVKIVKPSSSKPSHLIFEGTII